MTNNISSGAERFDPEFDNVGDMGAAPGASEQDQAMREFADEQAERDRAFEQDEPKKPEEPFGGFEDEAPGDEPQEEPDTHPMQEQPEPTNSDEQPTKEADRLDLTKPFFMTVYATDKRTYVERFQGPDAEKDAKTFAAEKATQSGHAVAVFGPQVEVYAIPQEVKAKPITLSWNKT